MTAEVSELVIEVKREGAVVGRATASLAHCVEDALFRSVVSGRLANDGSVPAFAWAAHRDAPETSAVTSLSLVHPAVPERRYETRAFAPQAHTLIASLLEARRIDPKDQVEWSLRDAPGEPGPRGLEASARRSPYPLLPADLADVPAGTIDVCIDAWVLRRAHGLAADPEAVERAGLLVGKLQHDASREALRLRIFDVVDLEARPGGASGTHFSFLPSTFLDARRALRARGDAALAAGWLHTHPPCRSCWTQPHCKVDWVFFSAADVEVHASAFGRPFQVGLVVGKVGELPARRPGFRLYGWSRACVERRDFRVTGAGAERWDPELETFGEET